MFTLDLRAAYIAQDRIEAVVVSFVDVLIAKRLRNV